MLIVFIQGVRRVAMGSWGILASVVGLSGSSSSFFDAAGLLASPFFSAKYRLAITHQYYPVFNAGGVIIPAAPSNVNSSNFPASKSAINLPYNHFLYSIRFAFVVPATAGSYFSLNHASPICSFTKSFAVRARRSSRYLMNESCNSSFEISVPRGRVRALACLYQSQK